MENIEEKGTANTNPQGDGDSTAGEVQKETKTFTQDEVDALIKERLKRESKKEEKAKATNQDVEKIKDNATNEKISALETKLLCYEKDIAKDNISDVISLAKSYVNDETDLEKAIDKVLAKYPTFTGAEPLPTRTGVRTQGDGKKISGVEAEFLRRNPKLKL